ncbi:MAG: polysaccharide lyase family 7 protein [Nevskia sp.]|uniref:polysaccharide lyase family 7 protein n=1 Tax=Nevskia sp. TaxID=1929292 RepID=UPI004036C1A0
MKAYAGNLIGALIAGSVPLADAAVIDLSPWKLTLPISYAASPYPAMVVNPATQWQSFSCQASPPTTCSSSPYFYSPDGGVTYVFSVPDDGAVTSPGSGSDNPRSELHEITSWYLPPPAPATGSAGSSSLNATLVVNSYPSIKKDIIVGQLHGKGADEAPYVMLHWDDTPDANNGNSVGNVYAIVKYDKYNNVYPGTGSKGKKYLLASGINVGSAFSYTIFVDPTNHNLRLSAWLYGSPKPSPTLVAIDQWAGMNVIFAAGDYVQQSASVPHPTAPTSTDTGDLTFTKLLITHN